MDIKYRENPKLAENEIKVIIEASELDKDVMKLMSDIENLGSKRSILAINMEDRLEMLSYNQIILIEVFTNQIIIQSVDKIYETKGQLKTIYNKLPKSTFIQISKNTIINIDHLDYLEAAFSGNMTAFLTNKVKTNVSRKYLPDLKKLIGL